MLRRVVNTFFLEQHPYHIVNMSPWPFLTSLTLWNFALDFLAVFHFCYTYLTLIIAFCFFCFSISRWFFDIVIEATFEGHHNSVVQDGIRLGMILFIVSEGMFFFSFFWAFLHSSLIPSTAGGFIWPPAYLVPIDCSGFPLVNTGILLLSGVSVTFSHYALVRNYRHWTTFFLLVTIANGVWFTFLQICEYRVASFSINDGVFGSCFYLCTGFHGFHVVIGTIYLIVCLFRHLDYHFTAKQHVGFECCIWYWHFVDVIWLLLFGLVYVWSGSESVVLLQA